MRRGISRRSAQASCAGNPSASSRGRTASPAPPISGPRASGLDIEASLWVIYSMTFHQRAISRVLCDVPFRRAAAGVALLVAIPACGGAPPAVVAAGELGQDVSGHADAVPQGAEVCALKDALATGGGP